MAKRTPVHLKLERRLMPIADFPGYFVSKAGFVFSNKIRRWKRLNPKVDKDGYRKVNLYREGERQRHFVHRLVLAAFVGSCPVGKESRHLNGIPYDNRLENLCWGTHRENCCDKTQHGTHNPKRGEKNYNSKLTDRIVVRCRRLYRIKEKSLRQLAKKYGVDFTTMRDAVFGYSWSHLDG